MSWRLHMALWPAYAEAGFENWMRENNILLHHTQRHPPSASAAAAELRIEDLLAHWRRLGAHAHPWFTLTGHDLEYLACQEESHECLWLGEASLHLTKNTTHPGLGDREAVSPQDLVEGWALRKPNGRDALTLACGLASHLGPIVVHDADIEPVFLIAPGDAPSDFAGTWPWTGALA